MPDLKVSSSASPDERASVVRVTPDSAGWEYVGFEVLRLEEGRTVERDTGGEEACLVILSGYADVATAGERWAGIGERECVFEGPPYAVYLPPGTHYGITAVTDLEVAVCSAPAEEGAAARLIRPDDTEKSTRGTGNMERGITNILMVDQPAERLLVVEVITPGGHWSSYPPHKHDREALPEESYLEETYYHRLRPEGGFALQRVYTGDRTLDETLTVEDGDAVLVPRGYHAVSAPPGYDLYYLNVMAGPVREWKVRNDPDHEWLLG